MRSTFLLLAAILTLTAVNVPAQEKDVTAQLSFYGNQPTVVSLPVPAYPIGAKSAGVGGAVSVRVAIDSNGIVGVLGDATGPYPVCDAINTPPVAALRKSATAAALKARFEPGAVFDGRLVYTFAAPEEPRSLGNESRGVILGEASPTKSTCAGCGQEVKMVSGGVLNGKALALPSPTYPPAAKAVRASGAVAIQVLIGEDGLVYSAQGVTGHPLLRRASEVAACGSKFMPTLLEGMPVKVSGIITYNYNL